MLMMMKMMMKDTVSKSLQMLRDGKEEAENEVYEQQKKPCDNCVQRRWGIQQKEVPLPEEHHAGTSCKNRQ